MTASKPWSRCIDHHIQNSSLSLSLPHLCVELDSSRKRKNENALENSLFPVPQPVRRSPRARGSRRGRGEYGGHLLAERALLGRWSGLLVAQVGVRRVRALLSARVRRVRVLPRQVEPRRRVHHDPAVQLRLGRDRGRVVGVGKVLLRVQVRKQHERLLRVGVLQDGRRDPEDEPAGFNLRVAWAAEKLFVREKGFSKVA